MRSAVLIKSVLLGLLVVLVSGCAGRGKGATRATSTEEQAATAQALPSAAERVRVEVEGLSGAMQNAALSAIELRALADRPNPRRPQIERLHRLAPEQIRRALEPYGYYQVEVDGQLEYRARVYHARYRVSLGAPVRVVEAKVRVEGPGAEDATVRRAVERFNPKPGEVLDHTVYEADKTAIGNTLSQRGFLDAKLVQARVEVHRAEGTARIRLLWQSGERYRIGSVRFSGSPFSEAFLARYLPFKLGDRYSQTRLLNLQQRLVDSDYFQVVEVGPVLDEAHDGVVPIEVRLEPAKRSVYSGGFAVGTDSGVGVRSGLERRYVNAAGHKLKLEADVAQKLTGLAAGYVVPVIDRRLSSWSLTAAWRDRETATARERLLSAGVRRLTEWEGWQLAYGVNAVSGAFTVADERGDTHLLYGVARIQRREADDFNAVRRGYLLAAELRGAASGLGSRTSFATVLGEARWIGSFGAGTRVLTRATLGLTWTDRFERLPPDLRFFAGGDRSLRGYDFQALGSTNARGRVIGGRYLVLGSLEVEQALSEQWAGALFLDAGNAFDAERKLKLGPGLGVRWRSPVGLVRLDLAAAWREPGRPLRLHLVLGPDL